MATIVLLVVVLKVFPKVWAAEARKNPLNEPSRIRLEGMAYNADMPVRQSVTVGLTHLVTGKNAGPKKIEQAAEVGAKIIDEADFYTLNISS